MPPQTDLHAHANTLLTVPLFVDSFEQAVADTAIAAEHGADLVELRVDQFSPDDDSPQSIPALIAAISLPCILTCRPTWEGGLYPSTLGDEPVRAEIFANACNPNTPPPHTPHTPHPTTTTTRTRTATPRYIDIELKAWTQDPNFRSRILAALKQSPDTGLILSSHDFDTRPNDLLQRLENIAAEPACDVIKLAWRSRSLRDNLEAFEIITQKHKPTIALCMGQTGLPSRVLAKKFAALLTFAALDNDAATAPGQPTVTDLKSLYRWDKITPNSNVYGVIGHPVGHSLSPAIHNAGFDTLNNSEHANAVYLPMPIPPEYEHFKATVAAWLDSPSLNFRGASVTIPHKTNLLKFVKEHGGTIDPLAEKIGAANTLTVQEPFDPANPFPSLLATNSDYDGAIDSLCAAMQIDRDGLKDKRVAVLGAGGAARAIVAGLTHHHAHVTIHNRTLKNAQTLADEFNANADTLDAITTAPAYDILINLTPLGMHPKTDASPLPDTYFADKCDNTTLVFDTIYNPYQTKFLQQAAAAGCQTIPGSEMFVRQAAAQFTLWTKTPAPLKTFRAVVLNRLNA